MQAVLAQGARAASAAHRVTWWLLSRICTWTPRLCALIRACATGLRSNEKSEIRMRDPFLACVDRRRDGPLDAELLVGGRPGDVERRTSVGLVAPGVRRRDSRTEQQEPSGHPRSCRAVSTSPTSQHADPRLAHANTGSPSSWRLASSWDSRLRSRVRDLTSASRLAIVGRGVDQLGVGDVRRDGADRTGRRARAARGRPPRRSPRPGASPAPRRPAGTASRGSRRRGGTAPASPASRSPSPR